MGAGPRRPSHDGGRLHRAAARCRLGVEAPVPIREVADQSAGGVGASRAPADRASPPRGPAMTRSSLPLSDVRVA